MLARESELFSAAIRRVDKESGHSVLLITLDTRTDNWRMAFDRDMPKDLDKEFIGLPIRLPQGFLKQMVPEADTYLKTIERAAFEILRIFFGTGTILNVRRPTRICWL